MALAQQSMRRVLQMSMRQVAPRALLARAATSRAARQLVDRQAVPSWAAMPAPQVRMPTMICRSFSSESTGDEEPTNQIFVSNLSWKTTSDGLADHFASHSGFSRAMVMMKDGRSRGMGLVEFDTPSSAQAAMSALHETELDGRTIFVRPSRPAPPRGDRPERGERPPRRDSRDGGRGDRGDRPPRPPPVPGTRLYVNNLSFTTNWQGLKDVFNSTGGNVEFVKVVTGEDGRPRGFGFVSMSSPEEAERAIKALDGTELDGRTIGVQLASSNST